MLNALLAAVPTTIALTCCAVALGAVGGILLMLARQSRLLPVRWVARVSIDLIRGIPPAAWILILFFSLSSVGLLVDPFIASGVALGIIAAAYLAEIMRGSISAVAEGQVEAAAALGLTRSDIYRRVVVPQAFRIALPPSATYIISLLKDSSFASAIGLSDVTFVATNIARSSGDPLTPFFVAAVIYIVLSFAIGLAARLMDSKLRAKVSR